MIIEPTINTGNQKEVSLAFPFLIFRYIFTQNAIAGAAIRVVVRNKEPTSGPNTSLPPQTNF